MSDSIAKIGKSLYRNTLAVVVFDELPLVSDELGWCGNNYEQILLSFRFF